MGDEAISRTSLTNKRNRSMWKVMKKTDEARCYAAGLQSLPMTPMHRRWRVYFIARTMA